MQIAAAPIILEPCTSSVRSPPPPVPVLFAITLAPSSMPMVSSCAILRRAGPLTFIRYAEETDRLPDKYVDRNGEVLLALNDHAPAACLAFWASPADASGATCEIKRLFVAPAYRNLGLARTLLAEAMRHAPSSAASAAWSSTPTWCTCPPHCGSTPHSSFKEYGSRAGNIAFFERAL